MSISEAAEGENKMKVKRAKDRIQQSLGIEKHWPHRKENLELAVPRKLAEMPKGGSSHRVRRPKSLT